MILALCSAETFPNGAAENAPQRCSGTGCVDGAEAGPFSKLEDAEAGGPPRRRPPRGCEVVLRSLPSRLSLDEAIYGRKEVI